MISLFPLLPAVDQSARDVAQRYCANTARFIKFIDEQHVETAVDPVERSLYFPAARNRQIAHPFLSTWPLSRTGTRGSSTIFSNLDITLSLDHCVLRGSLSL